MPIILEVNDAEENHYEQLDFDDADDNMRRYVPGLINREGGLWGRD